MKPIVAVIAPGMMGSAVANRLTDHGVEVRSLLTGRSAATLARARDAGMVDANEDGIAACDFILSIVPPGEAIGLAQRLAPAMTAINKKPIYVDCNAVAPTTVQRIAAIVQGTGAIFVDGGIIGPPPIPDSKNTKIYLSGDAASQVIVLRDYGLNMPVQEGPIGAASAMKLSYAGFTKGFTALGAGMMLAATRAGTADALIAEMSASQPALFGWLTRQTPKMPDKAYRWVAEMEEISTFVSEDPASAQFYAAAAQFYERIAADLDGAGKETADLNAFCAKKG
jgi:L-threonate 2-dehydrogenase